MNPDGTMARLPDLIDVAERWNLHLVTIADLETYLRDRVPVVERRSETTVPLPVGVFRVVAYEDARDGLEHLALVHGDVTGDDVLVRVHSECMTGDVFGSMRCDCGPQLGEAMRVIAAEGRGVVVYLRGHEGRGIGLVEKLRAYQLQDAGHDTVDANLQLGHPVDARDYRVAAHVLGDLGVTSVRLLTNNPDKHSALETLGVPVTSRVALEVPPTAHNLRYLTTKRDKLGHTLTLAAVLGTEETA